MTSSTFRTALAICTLSLLAACGDSGERSATGPVATNVGSNSGSSSKRSARQIAMTPQLAARFLTQATFGPTMQDITALSNSTPEAWLNSQFEKPHSWHRSYFASVAPLLPAKTSPTQNQFFESFWKQAVTGDDQLRQRVVFALSEMFVISYADTQLADHADGVAGYYDMLGQRAFGNFRDLLESVALHPMMGLYLSHLRNQKEDDSRLPDENFAREIMQLFTIGLYQLNPDGTLKLQNGKPIETYTHDDVQALARVFTGWSWAGPDKTPLRFFGATQASYRDWMPMQQYPAYHSTLEKKFLGTTIAPGSSGADDLRIALDTLFHHPNVGPFISRQLIQRLVTSNPSPAYVSRVAAAFNDNGRGIRGDMRAVISAILLDDEARDPTLKAEKVREPIVRLANWMRAFNASSTSKRFMIGNLDDPQTGLGQSPMRSPSVFNFYRPGYVPPNGDVAKAGMVAPEMQITGEPSVTGYLNFMQAVVPNGLGTDTDVKPNYAAELALAIYPDQLLDRVDLLLTGGNMTPVTRKLILNAINSVNVPAYSATTANAVALAKNRRVYLAVYLTMASPEYIVQK